MKEQYDVVCFMASVADEELNAIENGYLPSSVHYCGNACDMDTLLLIGKEYNIPIVEDAAHALGSS